MRKMRLFQRDAYIGIDFLEKKAEIVRLKDPGEPMDRMDFPIDTGHGNRKIISVQLPEVPNINSIRAELADFAQAIINNSPTRVSIIDGFQALEVAHQILEKMSLHNKKHNV